MAAKLQELAGPAPKVLKPRHPGIWARRDSDDSSSSISLIRFLSSQIIYYMLNLNDFSRRDTIYEGADNGLLSLPTADRLNRKCRSRARVIVPPAQRWPDVLGGVVSLDGTTATRRSVSP